MPCEIEEQFGPAYNVESAQLKKCRRAARDGLASLTKDQRNAYAAAVEAAVLASQRASLQRELPSHNPRCASGTAHNTGAAIHRAIRQQQRAALDAYPAKVRRERTPAQWRAMYDAAMADKRRLENGETLPVAAPKAAPVAKPQPVAKPRAIAKPKAAPVAVAAEDVRLSPAQKAWQTRRAKMASAAPVAKPAGFGEAAAFADPAALGDADLLALFARIGRAVADRFLIKRPALSSWQLVLDYLNSVMAHEKVEQFRVVFLDKRNNLIADEVLGTGTVDHVPVYPREVLRRALELHALALLLVHNHPSGNPEPSRADVQMTKQIIETANPLGIAVHDHIVIGREGHASLRALKMI
ncbi:hypothetical protein ACVMGC_004791 [Bradyrhizobium barranii subsp. barranii]|uniref:JAB domain-containing protein n=1 Tax=Bradyrhizobium liaoningense TaxID=43992 RepID=UPI00201156DB|nr:DNA repair protein RadC [Bradyrhizobium liaoningense]